MLAAMPESLAGLTALHLCSDLPGVTTGYLTRELLPSITHLRELALLVCPSRQADMLLLQQQAQSGDHKPGLLGACPGQLSMLLAARAPGLADCFGR